MARRGFRFGTLIIPALPHGTIFTSAIHFASMKDESKATALW
jgi:hypothetical protein